jgi:hypothetical protein
MSTPQNERPAPGDFNTSWNCIDIVIDEPGDTTVRPITGKRREELLAERERLAPWLEQLMRQHQENPPPGPDSGDLTIDVELP